jgi:hypothetical protein
MSNSLGALVALPWLLVLLASLLAFAALCQVLVPSLIARARRNLERRALRSGLVGLINVLFFGLIALVLLGREAPGARLLGAIVGTLLVGVVVLGSVAIARLAGERLRPGDDELRQQLVGMGTLWLAMLVPIVGWYLLSILVGLIGAGATILGIFNRDEPAPAPIDVVEAPLPPSP